MEKNIYKYNEKEIIESYFELETKEVRKNIKRSRQKDIYSFYLEFALSYMVNIKKIRDYKVLNKCLFRYLVIITYIGFKNSHYSFLKSDALKSILKNKITIEVLTEDLLKVDGNDIWGIIYNKCKYDNDFDEVFKEFKNTQEKKDKDILIAIDRIPKALFSQRSFFAGSQPLLDSFNEDTDNQICLDALICKALYNNHSFDDKITFEYQDLDSWREYIADKNHCLEDIRSLTFILREAIKQECFSELNFIKVKGTNYYQALWPDVGSGSYKKVSFLRVDSDRNLCQIDYSSIESPLVFKINNDTYQLSKTGLSKL